jgi:hypothetical protein
MLDSPCIGSVFLLFSFPCIIFFKKRLSSPRLGYYLLTKAAAVAFSLIMEQNARNASSAPHACVRPQALVDKSQASAKQNAHANPWAADALRQPPLLSMCVFRSLVSSTLGAAGDLGAPPTKPRRTTVAACHSPPGTSTVYPQADWLDDKRQSRRLGRTRRPQVFIGLKPSYAPGAVAAYTQAVYLADIVRRGT